MILTKKQVSDTFEMKSGCANCGRYNHGDVMALVTSHEKLRELLYKFAMGINCWCPTAVGHPTIREHTWLCREITKALGLSRDT